jgi:hypothetical protein
LGIIVHLFTGKINPKFPPLNSYKSSKAKQPNLKLSSLKLKMKELLGNEKYGKLKISKVSKNIFFIKLIDNKL